MGGGSSRVGIARSGSDLADLGGRWRLSQWSGYDTSPMSLGSRPEEVLTYALPTAPSPPPPGACTTLWGRTFRFDEGPT